MQVTLIDFLKISYFGLSIYEVSIIVLITFICVILRSAFANFILNKIKKLVITSKNEIDDDIFLALYPPLKFLPIVLIFLFITIYFNIDEKYLIYLKKINQTLFSIFIFWLLHSSVNLIFNYLKK